MKEIFENMNYAELVEYLSKMKIKSDEIMYSLEKSTNDADIERLFLERKMIDDVLDVINEVIDDRRRSNISRLDKLRNQVLEMKQETTKKELLDLLDLKLKELDDLYKEIE